MAPTQEALYAGLDLDLSWSERELPERERTKHVHRLHPYLGKFIPQLVEVLLERYVPAGGRVLDPFAGSGTTLVQSLESGRDATGGDIAAFNCLLMRVKTARYNEFTLEKELRDACSRLERPVRTPRPGDSRGDCPRTSGVVRAAGAARAPLLACAARRLRARRRDARRPRARGSLGAADDALRPRVSSQPRSVSRTGATSTSRECRPVERAEHFLRRYALDTLARIKAFARVRGRGSEATILHGDARELDWGGPFDAVVTSPPYPGLIDYHEQHRYAYELLELDDLREREIGAAASGHEPRWRLRRLRRRHRRGADQRRYRAPPRSAAARGRQRPSRALPVDPRAGGASSRRPATAPREPPYRAARRRVLRGRPRLHDARRARAGSRPLPRGAAMRFSSGGCVEKSLPKPVPRNPDAWFSGLSMYMCAIARLAFRISLVSTRSLRSASAIPSASFVISAADASARYSRRRETASWMTTPAIGAISSAAKAMIVRIGFEPRLPPPKNAIRRRTSESSAITPTSTATSVISLTSRLRMCETSCASTPSSSRSSISWTMPGRHGDVRGLGVASGRERIGRRVLDQPQLGRLLEARGDGDVLEQPVELGVVALLDPLRASPRADHRSGGEPGEDRVERSPQSRRR